MVEQLSLFNCLPLGNNQKQFKISKPIRLIELFAGIGAQAKALENLGIDFEHYKIVEFDKYAVASYNEVHGTKFETSDITKVRSSELEIRERERFTYIMTYSFPCQDLSLAGKNKGMAKGSGTRSGLLWEVERLLDELDGELPQVLLMENVPQVIGKKNMADFYMWKSKLEALGYKNYIQILNAKDYGIPQNRKRCFMVSILGNYTYQFPTTCELKIKLKDLLEDNVDEKYYLSDKMMKYLQTKSSGGIDRKEIFERNLKNTMVKGLSPTLTTREGSRATDTYIVVKSATKQGYAIAKEGDDIDLGCARANHRGSVQSGLSQTLKTQCDVGVCVVGNYMPSGHEASRILDPKGLAPTIKENHGTINAVKEDLRVRKLTPKECWRLMGFSDIDYEKASKVVSNSQLYKQAGNSIVVNVLEAIFKQMM